MFVLCPSGVHPTSTNSKCAAHTRGRIANPKFCHNAENAPHLKQKSNPRHTPLSRHHSSPTMAPSGPDISALPDEMFTIIKSALSSTGARLGHLRLPHRHLVETPHYLALTSRGVVPHLTQDTFRGETGIVGVYVPLEDCTPTQNSMKRPQQR